MSDRTAIQFDSPDELVIVGLDSEYEPGNPKNELLSYQTHGIYRAKAWSCFFEQRGKRLTLAEVLAKTLQEGRQAGAFDHYPEAMCLAIHWSLADLTMLSDFEDLKDKFDGLRKTYATVSEPYKLAWTDSNRHQRDLTVHLVDTKLLAPAGGKLANIGELHGLPKIELPPGAIQNMKKFLDEHPAEFRAYAMRDAEIAAHHTLYMIRFHEQWVGGCKIPITLGGLAKDFGVALWKRNGTPWSAALGFRIVAQRIFTSRGARTIQKKEPLPGYTANAGIALEAYSGGRNECFCFGASPVSNFVDFDFAGCYSTILSMVEQPQYDKINHTTDVEAFGPATLGFARLRFSFPTNVRFPAIAIRTDAGLIFPRTGTATVTAPEIFVAKQLGAELVIEEGIVVPTEPVRIFRDVIVELTRLRTEHKTDPLLNPLFKEMANSLYGKLGQGLRPKTVFDTRTGASKQMPKSALTNPFYASHVTGFARALLAEVLNALPVNRIVISATTDGFATDATPGEARAATAGPLARQFARARLELSGGEEILEAKHQADQLLSWRTRGVATLQYFKGGKLILARAGLHSPDGYSAERQNEWVIQQFLEREVGTHYEIEVFRSMREIWSDAGDLTKEKLTRRMPMDYDFKRQSDQASTVSVLGHQLLSFTTKPWRTIEEFKECREQWQVFSRESGRCLKTEGDLTAVLDYLQTAPANQAGVYRSICSGPVVLAVRQVCRAFVRNEWGFDRGKMRYSEFATLLSNGGYHVTATDIKNARRARLVPNVVPPLPEILSFVAFLKGQFPNFTEERLLQQSSAPQVAPAITPPQPAKNGDSSQILISTKLLEVPPDNPVTNDGVNVPYDGPCQGITPTAEPDHEPSRQNSQ